MKKSNGKLAVIVDILLVIAIVFLAASLFAGGQEDQAPSPVDPVMERAEALEKDLDLTESQKTALLEILREAQEQTAADRGNLKNDAVGLVKAARQRRRATNKRIAELLEPAQQDAFTKITRLGPFDRELFDITEGLMLDDMQSFDVEGILIEHYNKIKEMMPEGMEMEGPMGGRPEAGMRGGMHGGMRGGGIMGNPVKSLNSKKSKAIKKLLSKEQKVLFKQLLKDRQDKMKEMKKRR